VGTLYVTQYSCADKYIKAIKKQILKKKRTITTNKHKQQTFIRVSRMCLFANRWQQAER